MQPPPSSPALLSGPIKTITTLVDAFQTSLSSSPRPHEIPNPPNALSLLHDASSLLHALTTKLSLLLLNKPFTPSAIASILTSISSECLPGLMSVWELCDAHRYSTTLQKEVVVQLRATASGLLSLLEYIPQDEAAVKGLEGKREDILGATGQIWEVCDRMKKIAGMGIVGLALEKADAYHALVKDAVEEIEGWDPDEEEGSLFGSDSSVSEKASKEDVNGASNGINGNMKGAEKDSEPPALDGLEVQDMHAVKASALKALKFLRKMFPSLRKYRVSTLPQFDRASDVVSLPHGEKVAVLDRVLRFLGDFSEKTDEVAGALYGGDVDEVDRRVESLRMSASKCLEEVKVNWDGREDGFSTWSQAWVTRAKEKHFRS